MLRGDVINFLTYGAEPKAYRNVLKLLPVGLFQNLQFLHSLRVFFAALPKDVQHYFPYDGEDFLRKRVLFQQVDELLVQFLCADVAAAAFRVALVVMQAFLLHFIPCKEESAIAALYEFAQRIFRCFLLLDVSVIRAVCPVDSVEHFLADYLRMVSLHDTVSQQGMGNAPAIERIAENLSEPFIAQIKSPCSQAFLNLHVCDSAFGLPLECLCDEPPLIIDDKSVLLGCRVVNGIASWRLRVPVSAFQTCKHPCCAFVLAQVVLELVEKENQVLHKLPGHIVIVDGLRHGDNGYALCLEIGLCHHSLRSGSGEAVEGIDQDGVYLTVR